MLQKPGSEHKQPCTTLLAGRVLIFAMLPCVKRELGQSESSLSQLFSHDDNVSSIVAHGAEVGSSRAPPLMGPYDNLIVW
jgi:hypothetical protein